MDQPAVLWQLDARRQVFRVPGGLGRDREYLGDSGGERPPQEGQPPTGAVDEWADVGSVPPAQHGRQEVFVTTSQLRGELVRYDLAFHQFKPYLRGISATYVNFSRDGKWVTYVAYPEGTLWRSEMDGSERLQLTFPPLDVVQPRWSPDGTRIAFADQQLGKPSRVYVISAEGGGLEEPLGEDHPGADPNWSQDGESLLFARPFEDETPGVSTLELEIVDLRTRAVSKVPGSEELWSPRWSLDGRHILAFPRAADRLMLLDVKNQRWTELAKINIGGPEWSREGDYIYFLSAPPAGQHSGIFRVRISDRKLERVAGLEDFRQASGSGGWVGLAPDDSLLLVRDAGTQDIYALDWEAP